MFEKYKNLDMFSCHEKTGQEARRKLWRLIKKESSPETRDSGA
jgi:hypothetical protein